VTEPIASTMNRDYCGLEAPLIDGGSPETCEKLKELNLALGCICHVLGLGPFSPPLVSHPRWKNQNQIELNQIE